MKKIIAQILYTDLDNSQGQWIQIPMIPASGTLRTDSEKKKSGRMRTYKLNFKMYCIFPEAGRNLSLLVTFDDGSKELIGTYDIPASLAITKKDVIEVECKWEVPEHMSF